MEAGEPGSGPIDLPTRERPPSPHPVNRAVMDDDSALGFGCRVLRAYIWALLSFPIGLSVFIIAVTVFWLGVGLAILGVGILLLIGLR